MADGGTAQKHSYHIKIKEINPHEGNKKKTQLKPTHVGTTITSLA